jgi:Mg-chelatase subunit ChlD
MSLTRFSLILCTAFIMLAAGTVAAQQPHLSFADPVKMLDCNPVSAVPCFTASFNIVDDRGQPAGVELGNNLVSRIKMTADNTQVQVFYAAAAAQARHGRMTMILVDISGSMARKLPTGETRFLAARSALAQFLYDFRDGVDQVAIVPFESHNVISTIQGAAFAQTRDEAQRQVNSLPVPRPQNNTALFSAVVAGLDALNSRRKDQPSDVDTLLVVMTDGTNDVRAGDDPGLLAGSAGQDEAHNRVARSGIQVNAIGFGDPAAIDQVALRQISTRPPIMAVSADNLNQAINQTRKLFTDKLQVAFLTTWTDTASLAGKNMAFRATLDLPDRRRLSSDEGRFETPQMGSPVPSGKAGPELLQALGNLGAPVAAQPGLLELLRPVFVFLGLGVVLLIAWFWVPRLIWPGQYMGSLTLPKSSMKWSGPTQVRQSPLAARGAQAASRGMPRGNVPPGFESDSGAPGQRTPRDATVVQPMGEATRIRLEREQK